MRRPVKPYIAGNPVGNTPVFVGREDVLRRVKNGLGEGIDPGIVLYGQRRIGKTSILHHLAAQLPQQGGYRTVYFDLQDKASWSLVQVISELAKSIANAMGLPNPSIPNDPEEWFRNRWLSSVLSQLSPDASLFILFDEFDVLADGHSGQAGIDFYSYIRPLLENPIRGLRFVFVIGRNIDDLPTAPYSLFKGIDSKKISLITEKDTETLIRVSETEKTLCWSQEAVKQIWLLTCGHPLLVQQVCSKVWDAVWERSPSPPPITAADVRDSLPEVLKSSRGMLDWLWQGFGTPERTVAAAIAAAGSGAISDAIIINLLRKHEITISMRALREAQGLLVEWEILERVPMEGGDSGHQFRVELLRQWVSSYKSLANVYVESAHAPKDADSFYRVALDELKDNPAQAKKHLQTALQYNAYHGRATETLADLLIDTKELAEARQFLEKIYEVFPSIARPRLIRVLIEQATFAETDDERLELFERVLGFEKKNLEAASGKTRIWKERAERARSEGRFEEALQAYNHAELFEAVNETRDEMRQSELAKALEEIADLERKFLFESALERIEVLSKDFNFNGLRDWLSEAAKFRRLAEIEDAYHEACRAFENGKKDEAIRLLSKVIALDPKYRDAARILFEAITAVQPRELLTELEAQKAKLHRVSERLRSTEKGRFRARLTTFIFVVITVALVFYYAWQTTRLESNVNSLSLLYLNQIGNINVSAVNRLGQKTIPKNIKWHSENRYIAEIDDQGNVTPVMGGETYISISDGEHNVRVHVTVSLPSAIRIVAEPPNLKRSTDINTIFDFLDGGDGSDVFQRTPDAPWMSLKYTILDQANQTWLGSTPIEWRSLNPDIVVLQGSTYKCINGGEGKISARLLSLEESIAIACPMEACNDRADNDGDEKVDCEDLDCTKDPSCALQFALGRCPAGTMPRLFDSIKIHQKPKNDFYFDETTITSTYDIAKPGGAISRLVLKLNLSADKEISITLRTPGEKLASIATFKGRSVEENLQIFFDDRCSTTMGTVASNATCYKPLDSFESRNIPKSDGTWTLQMKWKGTSSSKITLNSWALGMCIKL